MHDTVINNAFFALLAAGATFAGAHALAQVTFAPQTLEAGATVGRFASILVLGA